MGEFVSEPAVVNIHKIMPQISVIVPVYNTETYLSRCIDSILAQTFTDFELLLINDGSTDNSGVICDEYAQKDSRIHVFHKPNGGVSSARNLGLDKACGQWIAFSDSDDWLDKSMYKEMYDKLMQEQADIAYCDIKMVFENYQNVYKSAIYSSQKGIFLNNFIASTWTSLCNVIARKSLFGVNRIRFPEGVAFAEDYHVSTRLMFFANKVCYVDKPLYCYNRINETSALHTFSPKHYEKERWVNLNIINFFKEHGMYEDCAETLSWRLLKSVQEYVLDRKTYDKFLSTHPDGHKYIWSCPYINFKIKVMMWSLSHHLRFIAELFLFARIVRLKLSNLR